MRLTADDLRQRYACAPQVALFESLFPDGVEVTEALCIEHAMRFDWGRAARNLFPTEMRAEYRSLVAAAFAAFRRKRDETKPRSEEAAWRAWDQLCRDEAAAFGRLAERLDSPVEGDVDSLTDRSVN